MSLILNTLVILLQVINIAILIRAVVSWMPMFEIHIDPHSPFMKVLHDMTEPILGPIRGFATWGMMDFSPIVAFFIIGIIIDLLRT